MRIPAFRYRSTVVAALGLGASALAICAAAPALAQDLSGQDDEIAAPYAEPPPALVTARPSGDQADKNTGKRQSRDAVLGIEPMARINNRIPSRVQNRIQNRIGRDYAGLSTLTDPSDTAAYATRRTDSSRKRR